MTKSSLFRPVVILLASLFAVIVAPARGPARRVVAIGDIHGDLVDFESILQRTGLINDRHEWIGGNTVLVQTGDVIDRGPGSRRCLDLLMSLEHQARRQNGRIIVLLGNHEVMAMLGDFRYVSAEDYQSFVTVKSEQRREEEYQDYLGFISFSSDQAQDIQPAKEILHEKWIERHPLGFFERRDAFSPQGKYGRWLRRQNAVLQLNDVVFVHGGLDPQLPFRNLRELNQRVRSDLAEFDSLWQLLSERRVIWKYMTIQEAVQQARSAWPSVQSQADAEMKQYLQEFLGLPGWFINSPESPLWYRGLALEPDETLGPDVKAMMARLNASYLVAGHTVQPGGRITQRLDNHIFLIDTGMLRSVFGGVASALEIRDGRFVAYYVGEKERVLLAPAVGVSSPKRPE